MVRGYVIAQRPNRPLMLAVAAAALARGTGGATARRAATAARLSLLWWSYEELVDGANAFRRLLGALGGAYCVSALVRELRGPSSASGPR
ncbi:MAG TPA: hypothetical protein VKV21_12270 [Solirubrobacteraceae bacterium]|nr:hypothetical protein [Solirubrobacteraceae bacterium]